MPPPATLQQVMNEIGPRLEIGEVIEYPEQQLWTLTIDIGTVVFAEYDEAGRQLILSVDVAELPSERRTELLDLLLRYNGRWEETGGLWMSLDGGGEIIQQCAVLPAADLDTRDLQIALTNFLDVMAHWRQQILHQGEAGAETNAASMNGDQAPPEFGIRI